MTLTSSPADTVSILAAYDLGTPAAHLKKIYDEENKDQRPIYLQKSDESIVVTRDNWVQYLSNGRCAEKLLLLGMVILHLSLLFVRPSAYGAFVAFFSKEIQEIGAVGLLEKYVFSEEANAEGAWMLTRVMAGAYV